MAKQYSESDLKAIGQLCGNKLPPASTVQAMFLYEMQRESELERLFQGNLFELARLNDETKSQQAQARELSEELKDLKNEVTAQIKALRKEIVTKDVEERVSTSNIRMDAIQKKLTQLSGRVDDQASAVAALQAKTNEHAAALLTAQDTDAKVTACGEGISLLFEERDGLFEMLSKATRRIDELEKRLQDLDMIMRADIKEIVARFHKLERESDAREKELNERIAKLEDLVRALTAQSPTTSTSSASQLIEVNTTNGQSLDLAVQKGSSMVPYKKENVRSFTPGKQWMA